MEEKKDEENQITQVSQESRVNDGSKFSYCQPNYKRNLIITIFILVVGFNVVYFSIRALNSDPDNVIKLFFLILLISLFIIILVCTIFIECLSVCSKFCIWSDPCDGLFNEYGNPFDVTLQS